MYSVYNGLRPWEGFSEAPSSSFEPGTHSLIRGLALAIPLPKLTLLRVFSFFFIMEVIECSFFFSHYYYISQLELEALGIRK